ncbi:MAG TPA: tRNA pseudouridine(54/55) synthase Pus10 [Nitrososphaera sp.]|nr:tRNA pseudouridine(54/55) synthase Pus10 [Nitrososphaera sp.]
MVDARAISLLKKQYKLCKRCSERHGFTAARSEGQCHICRGLMDDIDSIVQRITHSLRGYEFDTFLIGATLPTQIYEREDALRARLKIRGAETAKNQLTRELGMRLNRLLKKRVEYLRPDITISLAVDKENNVDVSIKSRPLAIAGRYIKKVRGISQRQGKCQDCEGKGCDSCRYSGLSGFDSIEGIIANALMEMTGGQTPRFSWVGSEDDSSLVLGRGRPFYVRVSNPKKRTLERKQIRKKGIMLATLSVLKDEPKLQPRFKVTTRIHIKCERTITKEDIKKVGTLAGAEVSFENKFKTATKRIHLTCAHRISDNEFVLTIVADGGLMIKQFVGGEEYMSPNVSEIVGAKCECVTFDVLDVSFQ